MPNADQQPRRPNTAEAVCRPRKIATSAFMAAAKVGKASAPEHKGGAEQQDETSEKETQYVET